MQFSPKDLLLESGDKQNELKRLDSVANYNRSYMSEALDFVSECDAIMDNATKNFYKALLEADTQDMVAITESFADFKETVSNIISKFLKFIKSLFERFITMLTGLVKAEGHLKKHKTELSKFSTEHEFKINGFEYTFAPGIPSLTPVDELNNITSNFNTFNAKTPASEINTAYQNQTDALETYYDQKRAQILGKGANEVVYESEYSDELYRQFRNGDNGRSEITITKTKVDEAYIRFDNYESTRKQVTKDKQNIESKYKELKNQLDKMGTRGVSGKDITLTYNIDPAATTGGVTLTGNDSITAMELLLKLHADKVQRLSDMHALAFAAKLDALKECFNQDKAILYKALSRVQKTAYKEATIQEGNVIVAKNVFILPAPTRDCDELFSDRLYKDEFNDDMDKDLEFNPEEDDNSIDMEELPIGDEEGIDTDIEFDVPMDDEVEEDDEVIHDDDDISDVEESLFFSHGLDKLIEESMEMMGGRL